MTLCSTQPLLNINEFDILFNVKFVVEFKLQVNMQGMYYVLKFCIISKHL